VVVITCVHYLGPPGSCRGTNSLTNSHQ